MQGPRHLTMHRSPSWVARSGRPGGRRAGGSSGESGHSTRERWIGLERSDLAPLPWVLALVVIYVVSSWFHPPGSIGAPRWSGQVGDADLPAWAQDVLERRE